MKTLSVSLLLIITFSLGFAQSKAIELTQSPVKISRRINISGSSYLQIIVTRETEGWPELIQTLDLKKLDAMPQRYSRNLIDETDTIYTVEINKETHNLKNPDRSSPQYAQMAPFINKLNEVIENLMDSTKEYPISITEGISAAEYGWNSVEIRKDSIIYQPFTNGFSTDLKKRSGKIRTEDWNELAKAFNAKIFAAVKSRKTEAALDGTDVYFTVRTNFGTYQIVNPDQSDPNLVLNRPFRDIFDRICRDYIKKGAVKYRKKRN